MRDLGADVALLRGYLLLLLGSAPDADTLLEAFLADMAEQAAPPPELPAMLQAMHCRLGCAGKPAFAGEGLSDAQRALNWRLRGLSVQERALVLLGALAPAVGPDPACILGLSADRFRAARSRAIGRLRCETAIVISRQAIVAMDLRSIVGRLGMLRVETARSARDLVRMVGQHHPAVVIADTDGLPEATLADCLSHGRHPGDVPAVLISAAMTPPQRFPMVLRKPFSSRALQAAVLDAIGA